MAEIVRFKANWLPVKPKRVKGKTFDDSEYYNSKEWQGLRRAFFGMVWDGKKYRKTRNLLCVACLDRDVYTDAVVADHIVQRNKGGADDEGNLQALCTPCHDRKSAAERYLAP